VSCPLLDASTISYIITFMVDAGGSLVKGSISFSLLNWFFSLISWIAVGCRRHILHYQGVAINAERLHGFQLGFVVVSLDTRTDSPVIGMNSPRCSCVQPIHMNDFTISAQNSRNIAEYSPESTGKHKAMIQGMIGTLGLGALGVQVLSGLTMPSDHSFSLGEFFGTRKTTDSNFQGVTAVEYSTESEGPWPGDLPVGTMLGFKYKDILRSAILYNGTQSGFGFSYQASGNFFSPATGESIPFFAGGANFIDNATAGSNLSLHGPVLYPGRLGSSDSHRGFLLSAGHLMLWKTALSSYLPTDILTFVIRYLEGKNWVDQYAATVGGSTGGSAVVGTFTAPSTGYYSLVFTSATGAFVGTKTNFFLEILGNGCTSLLNPPTMAPVVGGQWAQLPVATLTEFVGAVQSGRVNAASLMYENTSSPIYRQGFTVMRQLPPLQHFFDYFDVNQLENMKDSAVIQAVNGGYLFQKPNSMQEFDFSAPFLSDIVGNNDFSFDIIPNYGILVLGCQVQDTSGQAAQWFYSDVVEWSTNSQAWKTEQVMVLSSDLEKILLALSKIPQFHTNDFHLSDIWDAIKDVASDIWGGIKDVVGTVGPIAMAAAPLLLAPKGGKGGLPPKIPFIPSEIPKPSSPVVQMMENTLKQLSNPKPILPPAQKPKVKAPPKASPKPSPAKSKAKSKAGVKSK
jgi:hypothetical protein